MRINIIGKNIEVSDYLRDMVEKKVSKLERYFPKDTQVIVTMAVARSRHIVEVTIPADGVVLRAEEVTGDMYASIDNALDKLERQLHKHRTRLSRQLKSEAFKTDEPLYSDVFDDEDQKKVVKVKRFNAKPMTVDEAIMQMELVGHSFYVFFNAQTNRANVLYMRRDGNLGLIETTFD